MHRVGRTGRAESTGNALTLVAPEEVRACARWRKPLASNFNNDPEWAAPGDDAPPASPRRPAARRRGTDAVADTPQSPRSCASVRAGGSSRPRTATPRSARTARSSPTPARPGSIRTRGAGLPVLQAAPRAEEAEPRRIPLLGDEFSRRNAATTIRSVASLAESVVHSPSSNRKLLRQVHPLAVGCQLLIGPPVQARLLRLAVLLQRHRQIEVRVGVGRVQAQRLAVAACASA